MRCRASPKVCLRTLNGINFHCTHRSGRSARCCCCCCWFCYARVLCAHQLCHPASRSPIPIGAAVSDIGRSPKNLRQTEHTHAHTPAQAYTHTHGRVRSNIRAVRAHSHSHRSGARPTFVIVYKLPDTAATCTRLYSRAYSIYSVCACVCVRVCECARVARDSNGGAANAASGDVRGWWFNSH